MQITTNQTVLNFLRTLLAGLLVVAVVGMLGCAPAQQGAGDDESSADADTATDAGDGGADGATDADSGKADGGADVGTDDGEPVPKEGADGDTDGGAAAAAPAKDGAPDVAALIKQVAAGDEADRVAAIDELGKLRSDAKDAVGALIEAVANGSAEIRWHAARSLGAVGGEAKEAIGALTTALENDDAKTRAYAAFALGEIGDKSEPTVKALIARAIDDDDSLVRRASLSALHKIKPPREQTIPIMVQTLQDADPAVVTRALHSMAEMGGDAVPALVEALNNDKAAYWSCLVLCEIGSNGTAGDAAPQAVEGLTKAVSNEDPEVRMQALLALGEFGPAAKSAAPTAIKALESDEFDGARYAAAFALGKIGDPAAIQPLQKAFESEDSFQKMLAAQALARLESDNEEIVKQAAEQMAHSLASKDPAERAAAARGLAEFGGSSEVTAPALEKAVADAEPEVILDAMDAFVQLGAKAVPRVKRGLTNEKLRHYAIRILTRIGPDAKQAAPDIIEVLKNDDGSDPQFRAELQFGLGSIGSDDASAVPSLVESLNSDNEQVRNSAIFALRNIGPAAGEAAAALRKNLKSEDKFLALISAWSLLAIQPDDAEAAQEAVPALIAGLSWDNENVQIESAKALGELGPAAKSAVPELEKVKGSEALQAAVDEALKKIQG